MKFLTLGFLFALITASAFAADSNYTILGIAEVRGDEQILVDRSWRKDSPKRLEVKLRAASDTPSSKVVVKAYFYDANKKLVHTYNKPNLRWMGTKKGFEEVGLPATLEKNDVILVYFALTPELLKLNAKTTLIVFGDNDAVVVRSKNEVAPLDFSFPEKGKATEVKK